MRRVFLVALGWVLVVIGAALVVTPVPIPGLGLGPLLIGCAILSTHSKSFRRGLVHLRHRFRWLSERFDRFAHKGPMAVRHMVRRTHPVVLMRHARMRARKRVPEIGDPVRQDVHGSV